MNRLFVLLLTIWFCIPCFGQWTQLKDVPFINDHSNGFGFEGKGYIIQGVPGLVAEKSEINCGSTIRWQTVGIL